MSCIQGHYHNTNQNPSSEQQESNTKVEKCGGPQLVSIPICHAPTR